MTVEARAFQIIAHRGASAACPENTMAAFEAAIAGGVDMVEMDLTLCATGEFVIIHDDALDRTTDGSGLVCEWALDDLLKLDAGSWFAAEFTGERIPTVPQVLDNIAPRIPLNLEIKPFFALDQRDVFLTSMQRLIEALDQRRLLGRVLVSSFNFFVLRWLRQQDERLRLAFLYNKSITDLDPLRACKAIRAEACNPKEGLVTPHLLERLHAEEVRCYPYVVNSITRLRELTEMGIDGVFTDSCRPGEIPLSAQSDGARRY